MTDPKKWWLISDEDVQAIKSGLTGSLLHTLESGLHTTDEVPEDWKGISNPKIQAEMQKFLDIWTRAGKPATRDWYDTFRTYKCPNEEEPNACRSGYCPVGESDCCVLIKALS